MLGLVPCNNKTLPNIFQLQRSKEDGARSLLEFRPRRPYLTWDIWKSTKDKNQNQTIPENKPPFSYLLQHLNWLLQVNRVATIKENIFIYFSHSYFHPRRDFPGVLQFECSPTNQNQKLWRVIIFLLVLYKYPTCFENKFNTSLQEVCHMTFKKSLKRHDTL